jgi:hypothetical protein
MLRRIFGPMRDDKTGGWRRLYNEKLRNMYISANIISRRMIKSKRLSSKWQVAHIEEKRNAYRVLVGNPEGKEPLARSRHWWDD